jgi:hypothetical protein
LDAIRPNGRSARIDPNATEILAVVRRAMARTSLSAKAFCIAAACTESEFSEAINGKRGRRFEIAWLWKQADDFIVAFLDEVTETRGLTPENRHAIRRARIIELINLLLQDFS